MFGRRKEEEKTVPSHTLLIGCAKPGEDAECVLVCHHEQFNDVSTLLMSTDADVGAAQPIDLVYDRASLVALPLPMRMQYINKINELLPVGSQQFINTLEYAPLLPEPPFSITPEEVAHYYGANYAIQHLEAPELPEHRMVQKFNLRFLKEHGFLLTKVGDGCWN